MPCSDLFCSLPSNEFVPIKKPTNFSDVSKDAMHEFVAADIAACNRAGIVNGNTATTFSPDANLTRAQAVAILARVIKPSMREKNNYADECGKPLSVSNLDETHWQIQSSVEMLE